MITTRACHFQIAKQICLILLSSYFPRIFRVYPLDIQKEILDIIHHTILHLTQN